MTVSNFSIIAPFMLISGRPAVTDISGDGAVMQPAPSLAYTVDEIEHHRAARAIDGPTAPASARDGAGARVVFRAECGF
jgi:hypothetical protein